MNHTRTILHPTFWQAYSVQARPYLLFVSGLAGAAGLAFTDDIPPVRLVASLVASFLGYGFGQTLTDCFQRDTDALSSPYRPLVSGGLQTLDVFVVSVSGLAFCTAVFALANERTLAVGIGAVAGLLAYTWFKRRWWGGPPCNAAVVALLFVMGALAGSRDATVQGLFDTPGFVAGLAAVFSGYAHFVLAGYFKDIGADRATGYVTLPVRFGRGVAASAADGLAALCVVFGAWSVLEAGPAPVVATGDTVSMPLLLALAATAVGAAFFVVSSIRMHRVTTDEEAFRSIVPGLHAYLFVLASIVLARHAEWLPGLVAFHVLFALTLARRPEPSQV